jgi:hypothetical protein
MNPRRVVAPIVVAVLVIGVLVGYSLQRSPGPTTVTFTTVVEQTSTVTTTVLGHVNVVSATGSQAVLCATTSYFFPDTAFSTTGSTSAQTYSAVSDGVTTIFTASGGPQTTTYLATYASATNGTQSVGYVATTTSADHDLGLSYGYAVMTCTYLP